jgi:hypothetical protein
MSGTYLVNAVGDTSDHRDELRLSNVIASG